MSHRVLDLFSGIGGFSLGLERTGGFQTVAFCEIDPFCRKVLKKHWPEVPCYHDVRELTAERLAADGISVEVICGGFPCQDISFAGKRSGIGGRRSSLWLEISRLVGELRPNLVLVENVSALLSYGFDRVLGDLASLGLDAEWHCIPASAVGAPHRRDRVWLLAYPRHETGSAEPREQQKEWPEISDRSRSWHVADSHRDGLSWGAQCYFGPEGRLKAPRRDDSLRCHPYRAAGDWWLTEPDVGRVAHGVPSRVDRLRALGNAVVPQIPELIGRAILAAETKGNRI